MSKDPRNNRFYKDQDDCKLNEIIENNFNMMLNKLLNNEDFQLFMEKKKKEHAYNNGDDPQNFVMRDGIYPGYEKQKLKVLFIGRDSYGLRGYDYSESTWGKFSAKRAGGFTCQHFRRSVLSIAYCISRGMDIVQSPSGVVFNIYDMVAKRKQSLLEDFSFAFINASKLDFHDYDENDKKKKNNRGFDEVSAQVFVETVGVDLMRKQVDLINPNLIIGANLKETRVKPDLITGVYGCKPINGSPNSYKTFTEYEYTTESGSSIPFIDSKKHFSCFDDNEGHDTVDFIEETKELLKTKGMWK